MITLTKPYNLNYILLLFELYGSIWGVVTSHYESSGRKKTSTHTVTHGHTCTMSAGMHHQHLTLARFALWHCDPAVQILTQSLGLEVKEKNKNSLPKNIA